MRYQFYREHKYVSSALNDLERAIAKADFRNEEVTNKISNELHSLSEMLKGHAAYENEKLHPLIKNKGATLVLEMESDHLVQEEALENLDFLLQKIKEAKNKDTRVELGYKFYLAYRKFVADNLLHLHEEETLILPLLQTLYTDEELKKVEAETYRIMTAAQMIEMVQVLFPHMNPSDKEAFLRDIKEAEEEKYSVVLKAIQNS